MRIIRDETLFILLTNSEDKYIRYTHTHVLLLKIPNYKVEE